MYWMGIDPGTKKCGWALLDLQTFQLIGKGHDNLQIIRQLMITQPLTGITIENVVRYKISNSIDLLGTATMIGRLVEIATSRGIEPVLLTRPEVIQILTGKWPGKTHKVSKADLQKIVQEILSYTKPIRPQHANDATALIIAACPGSVALGLPRTLNAKTTQRRRRKPAPKSGRKPKRP